MRIFSHLQSPEKTGYGEDVGDIIIGNDVINRGILLEHEEIDASPRVSLLTLYSAPANRNLLTVPCASGKVSLIPGFIYLGLCTCVLISSVNLVLLVQHGSLRSRCLQIGNPNGQISHRCPFPKLPSFSSTSALFSLSLQPPTQPNPFLTT